jgi:hypothetical protein
MMNEYHRQEIRRIGQAYSVSIIEDYAHICRNNALRAHFHKAPGEAAWTRMYAHYEEKFDCLFCGEWDERLKRAEVSE